MRSEFEKLEEIANLFKIGNFRFNEDEGNYTGTKGTALSYLRGAWIAYQHQQSKVDELQKRVDDLTELNRLKTIALQQSVNRTSPYVHEKIVALEQALKGDHA